MKKLLIAIVTLVVLCGGLWIYGRDQLRPTINQVTIEAKVSSPLSIVLLADIHVDEDVEDLQVLRVMIRQINEVNPDLILLAGDYTSSPGKIIDLRIHREKIARLLSELGPAPVIAVLGNYEYASQPSAWAKAFDTTSISVLNNQIASTKVGGQALCIRGIGDRFTNNAVDVPFPSSCEQALKITLTHDPAAAFDFDLSGLIFAGHTHCGQVSFPFLGPLWVPTTAPKEAHCGLYQDDKKSLFVSSGTGTSLLPIRFGAPAQWDLIRLEPKN